MSLIEPTELSITSNIRKDDSGEFIQKTYRIGYYPSTIGLDMIGDSVELLDVMARKKTTGSRGELKNSLMNVRTEICKFIEVQLSNGNWIALSNDALVDAHVPDREMLGELLLRSHDYNSFFLNSGRALKIFQKSTIKVKEQISGMFTRLSDSLSAKEKQRSKR